LPEEAIYGPYTGYYKLQLEKKQRNEITLQATIHKKWHAPLETVNVG